MTNGVVPAAFDQPSDGARRDQRALLPAPELRLLFRAILPGAARPGLQIEAACREDTLLAAAAG